MSKILAVSQLSKTYSSGASNLDVLQDINFDIHQGEKVAIVGPSGSGKTTLLGLCAGLDNVTSGKIDLCGQSLATLNENQRAAVRNKHVGFIFQNFQLIHTLTAIENVMIPLELQNASGAKQVSQEMLDRVGLGERLTHYPSQLSGGEQQRVSLARAFSNTPDILFADEPTGNLDEVTGHKIENLLFELNKEKGTTLIIVTHDLELAAKTDRIIQLKGGRIISDELTKVKTAIHL